MPRWSCHKIALIPDLLLKLDITAAPVATHWRAVEDLPTEHHRAQTQLCAVRVDEARLKEETPSTLPDSTTEPEESQEPNEEGMAVHVCSGSVGITERYRVQCVPVLITYCTDVLTVAFTVNVVKGAEVDKSPQLHY